MLTSQIHASYGTKGLFVGLDSFELQSLKVEFANTLKADAREFMALVNRFFQASKFSYEGDRPTTEQYQEQRNQLSTYNQLLKLYLNTHISIELAFVKAIDILQTKGLAIPKLQGRLTSFSRRLKAVIKQEVMEEQLIELEASIAADQQAKEKVPFKTRLIKAMLLSMLKMAYKCHRFLMWLKKPITPFKKVAHDGH